MLQRKGIYYKMAIIALFILISNIVFSHCINYQQIEGNNIITNYSKQSLSNVPSNMSLYTTMLDLSYNNIKKLLIMNFNYMPSLRFLNVSHNKIMDLNGNIFALNKYLSHLDISNNLISNIYGTFPKYLKHLDVSFNNFKTTSMCKGIGNLLHLEYLGLGAAQILKSDLEAISHLHLQSMLIELRRLSDYENGSLSLLNTNKLHVILPINHLDFTNVLFDVFRTTKILELTNINTRNLGSDAMTSLSKILKISKVTHLKISQISLTFPILIMAMQHIWHSSVESMYVHNITLLKPFDTIVFNYSNTSMKTLFIERVATEELGIFDFGLYQFLSELNIENLSVNSARMLYMVCPSKPSTLQSITFLNNALRDDLFQSCATLINLKTLVLDQNSLEKFSEVSLMTRKMKSLKHLSIRQNQLHYDKEKCDWSQSIINLNLASNGLTETVFQCLPVNIKTLILENNFISHIPKDIRDMNTLEELNLASNQLTHFPDCTHFSNLHILNMESNIIFYASPEFIRSCHSLRQIRAGHNPFQCSCEIRSFINIESRSAGILVGWPDSYVCKNPKSTKGTKLNNVYLTEMQCNVLLLIPVIAVPTLFIFVVILGLCMYFDVPWFIRMYWQWTQTKHRNNSANKKNQLRSQFFLFHAFVSYSQYDSNWVKNTFLPNVEKDDDSIRICHHEKNFTPGKSIIQNIVNCIEKSYKSIFILSPHFVQSEWCHYELYFAHHKIYNEKSGNLILILLEPIDQYIISSKYSKLKALMAQKTYLEWPKEETKQRLFWANLREVININLQDEEVHTLDIDNTPV